MMGHAYRPRSEILLISGPGADLSATTHAVQPINIDVSTPNPRATVSLRRYTLRAEHGPDVVLHCIA